MQDPKIMNYFKEITFADINKITANMNSGTVRAYTRLAKASKFRQNPSREKQK